MSEPTLVPVKPKEVSRWEALQGFLVAPQAGPSAVLDDEQEAYRQLRKTLPGTLPDSPPVSSEPSENSTRMRYCLVECPNGAEPLLRVFRSPVAMAKHMAALDGQDTYVFPICGIPLPFTKGPSRILLLPDNTGYRLGKEIELVVTVDEELQIQENRFLGPIELAEMVIRDDPVPTERLALPSPGSKDEEGTETVGDPVPD